MTRASTAAPTTETEFLRQMNVGKAELENGDYTSAIVTFRAALLSQPDDAVALRNLSRALLFKGDWDETLATLERARAMGSNLVATEYLTGLAQLRKAAPVAAVSPLENAVRLDPHTATMRFQLAKTYEALGRIDDALTQYRETVRLDPQHAAAHFELAMYARKHREMDTYREELRVYKRLRDAFGDPETSPLLLQACRHTRAEAPVAVAGPLPTDREAARTHVRFIDATAAVIPDKADRDALAIAPLEMDASGRYTFVTLTAAGAMRLLTMEANGTLQRRGDEIPLSPLGTQPVIRVGHFHETVSSEDRLKTDRLRFASVLIVGETGTRLFERTSTTVFADVTEKAGLIGVRGRDACWADYESDGDLDLLVAGDHGLSLWQNGGDGTFTEVSTPAGVALREPCLSVGAADLDASGGVDVVVATGSGPTRVLENKRAGQFRAMPEPPGPWAPANKILIDDLDNDGAADAVLVGAERTVLKLGRASETQLIEHPGFVVTAAALVDYDNDGWLDLCLAGNSIGDAASSRVRVWRNRGESQGWTEVTADLALSALRFPAVRAVVAIDIDADGDTDLLFVTGDGQLVVLRNDGGNARGQLKIRLSSLAISNHGGIGSTIEVRSARTALTRLVSRELPIEIGVGALQQLDSIQVVWPDGTVDNQIAVTPVSGVVSVNRRSNIITGSCPYLYAWDGERFRFVSDFLGSGALGLAVTRDITWPSDPVEIVRIGNAGEFRPRNGRFSITVTSELREVDYFDSLRLVAVDHLPAVEVHPTDSFMPPPVTPSALWTVGDEIPLTAAHDTNGHDVTDTLRRIDGRFAAPGEILPPPLSGVCRPISYTLEFAAIPTAEPLVLAVTGLLEFGTASSNIALSQTSSASFVWPFLEAEGADGRWLPVPVNIGIPDGRTKTNVCDLAGKIPAGTRRLRLTTSVQIYWDRIALLKRRALPATHVHERAFSHADLRWRGFSRMELAADGLTRVPLFSEVTDQPPWHTTVEGWCTRYGDVHELISGIDGKIAVLNGGDAITLECPETVFPSVPDGYVRTFFLAVVGWDKEENANTVTGDSVGPLPGQPPLSSADGDLEDDWAQRFNTRWVPRNRFTPHDQTPPPVRP